MSVASVTNMRYVLSCSPHQVSLGELSSALTILSSFLHLVFVALVVEAIEAGVPQSWNRRSLDSVCKETLPPSIDNVWRTSFFLFCNVLFLCFVFFLASDSVPGRPGTEEFVPGQEQEPLSRDKGTPGQEIFFVPGQRDNGTSRPGLSRDVPRDVPSLGNPSTYAFGM